MKKNDPAKVGDIIASMKKKTELGAHLEQARIWEKWPEIVGPHLAAHGRPAFVRDKRLTIEVESPVWMHKFSYKKWEIIKRVNAIAGAELVSDVFITLRADQDSASPQDGV